MTNTKPRTNKIAPCGATRIVNRMCYSYGVFLLFFPHRPMYINSCSWFEINAEIFDFIFLSSFLQYNSNVYLKKVGIVEHAVNHIRSRCSLTNWNWTERERGREKENSSNNVTCSPNAGCCKCVCVCISITCTRVRMHTCMQYGMRNVHMCEAITCIHASLQMVQ